MAAQRRTTTTTVEPARPRARRTPVGRHVIDLNAIRPPEERMADYEQAFGLPSPLHHHTLPEVVSKRGIGRLRSLLHRDERP